MLRPPPIRHLPGIRQRPRPQRWLALLLLALLTTACTTQTPPATSTTMPGVEATATTFPAPVATTTPLARVPTATVAGTTPPPSPTATLTPTRTPTPRPKATTATGQPTATGIALVAPAFARVGLEHQVLTTLAVGGKEGQTIFAGGQGVYRSTDGGKTWTPVRSEQDAPRVTAIALAADNPQIVYVGVSDGCTKGKKSPGFVSKDGGATWRAIGDNLLNLVVDPKNAQRVYAITCTGLQRSDDGGGLWEPLSAIKLAGFTQTAIVHGPKESQLLYVASVDEEGAIQLARSNDGGNHWDTLALSHTLTGLNGLLLDPTDSRVIVLSTKQGLYRSVDSGKDWDMLADGLEATAPRVPPTAAPEEYRMTSVLAADPEHGGHFWVGTGAGKVKGVGVYRTLDAGTTWRKTAGGLEGRTVQALAIGGASAKRYLFVATDDGLWSIAVP